MTRFQANEEFSEALRLGQKEYKEATAAGKRHHPLVLDELLQDNLAESVVDVGLVEIPHTAAQESQKPPCRTPWQSLGPR